MDRKINSRGWVRCFVQIGIIIGLLHTVSASGNNITASRKFILSSEDPKITVQDLAFCLVTHDYDAPPRDGYVELQLARESYKLVPNGNAPGLCDISPLNATKKWARYDLEFKITVVMDLRAPSLLPRSPMCGGLIPRM